jgi:Luciferase-like monooxygenase
MPDIRDVDDARDGNQIEQPEQERGKQNKSHDVAPSVAGGGTVVIGHSGWILSQLQGTAARRTGIALISERDPILTAKEAASLDQVSAGRFCFGAGVGWLREEVANHGVDPEVRGRVAEERLHAIITIWTHEKAEFHGRFVDVPTRKVTDRRAFRGPSR